MVAGVILPSRYRNSRNSALDLITTNFLQKLELLLFYLIKLFLKSFGRCVEVWCDFLNVAILVFLGFSKMDGFHRRAPS
jgi:hypothetical protein